MQVFDEANDTLLVLKSPARELFKAKCLVISHDLLELLVKNLDVSFLLEKIELLKLNRLKITASLDDSQTVSYSRPSREVTQALRNAQEIDLSVDLEVEIADEQKCRFSFSELINETYQTRQM
jgi:hypothetical protein